MGNIEPKEEEVKNWDSLTKWILGFAILIIVFSFISPLIFTAPTNNERFDFSTTGQIGDTIGGLLNPFFAFVGILLTFLAFYMQLKANQIQIFQFNKSLKEEKNNLKLAERKDCYYKLNLLKVDLETIKSDINSKARDLKKYYEKEWDFPLETNILKRTPSKNYTRILEIDRLAIFKGFNMFLSNRDNWIKEFSNLYNILDFLPELFNDIYKKYDFHSKDLYERKTNISEGLNKFMDDLADLIMQYKHDYPDKDHLSYPASSLANQTILNFYEIVKEGFDENQNPVKETDLLKIDNDVLKYFLLKAMEQINNEAQHDLRLEPIVQYSSNLRKKIFFIKQKAQEFSSTVKNEYENLIIDKENAESYITTIENFSNILDSGLESTKIEE